MEDEDVMVTMFAFCMSACALDPTEDQTEQQAPDDPAAISTDEPAKDAGPVTPMFAACGTSGPNLQKQIIADAVSPNAANQRSGASTGCTALGALQPTDDVEYFCWTSGNDGTWTYLRNVRTGVKRWVRDDLLKNNGSNKFCGF